MALKKKWICDGCDGSTETELDADTCSFYQIKITAGAWGDDFILCPDCHTTLMSEIDPRKWVRRKVEAASK